MSDIFFKIGAGIGMDKDFENRMLENLLKQKEELLKKLISENEDFKAAVEDLNVNDLADVASNDIDCRTLEVLGTQDKVRLTQIESAISRLKNGKYGICARCSKRISQDRLEAIPYAVLCVDCKTQGERHHGK